MQGGLRRGEMRQVRPSQPHMSGRLCTLKYLDARTAGLATRTVSSASVLRRESLAVTGDVTRPLVSVPAGSTLLGDSATPALLDTTNIPTASVRAWERLS